MSDADELDDELLAVAGRPRQTSGKRRRQAAEDSDEDVMLSEVPIDSKIMSYTLAPPPLLSRSHPMHATPHPRMHGITHSGYKILRQCTGAVQRRRRAAQAASKAARLRRRPTRGRSPYGGVG